MHHNQHGRVCATCGNERPERRFTIEFARCDCCVKGTYRDLAGERARLKYERTRALRALPFTVDCAKCGHARPSSYYPWIPGQAAKGETCNACLRRPGSNKGGRPHKVTAAYNPGAPEHWTNTQVQRVIEREEARAAEAARTAQQGKRCFDCWHHKPGDAFRLDTRRRDQRCASCIECEAMYRRLSPLGQWVTVRDALRKLSGTLIAR